MVESQIDDFEVLRDRFEKLLSIDEDERSEDNLFELMRMTAKFKIFESFKMSNMHKEICRKMYTKTYVKGNIIFKQGDEGDAYYFVLRGSVDLYMYDVDQLEGKIKLRYLASILPGYGFGELALLYDCPRTATAIPNSKTDIVVFKKKLYNNFVKDLHERDLLELVRFYYSIPIFKNEPLSNILKYSLRTDRKIVNANEPFKRYWDYMNEYNFVKNGAMKVYVRIKVSRHLIRNANFVSESSFVTQLKNLQPKNVKVNDKAPPNKEHEYVYEEVVDIMEFNDKDMFGEYYASRHKRIDVHFIPNLPTEVVSIKSEDFKKINPALNDAIYKFSCPIYDPDRVFRKLHKNLVWKKNKSTLLYNAIKKKD